MNPNKALWEKGGFTRIARSMRESGERLVKHPFFSPAIGTQNVQAPVGRIGAPPISDDQQFQIAIRIKQPVNRSGREDQHRMWA